MRIKNEHEVWKLIIFFEFQKPLNNTAESQRKEVVKLLIYQLKHKITSTVRNLHHTIINWRRISAIVIVDS